MRATTMRRVRQLRSLAFAFLFLVPALAHAQPGQARLVESADAGANTFTWEAVTGATYYYLWVNEGDVTRHQLWYTSAQAGCATAALCRLTVLLPRMRFITATWWIQTWSPAGYGPWSTAQTFTIRPPKPAVVVDANGMHVGTESSEFQVLVDANGISAYVSLNGREFSRGLTLYYPTNDCTGGVYGVAAFDRWSFTSGGNGYLLLGPTTTEAILSRRTALPDGTFGVCTLQTFSMKAMRLYPLDLTSQFGSLTPPFKVVR